MSLAKETQERFWKYQNARKNTESVETIYGATVPMITDPKTLSDLGVTHGSSKEEGRGNDIVGIVVISVLSVKILMYSSFWKLIFFHTEGVFDYRVWVHGEHGAWTDFSFPRSPSLSYTQHNSYDVEAIEFTKSLKRVLESVCQLKEVEDEKETPKEIENSVLEKV